MALSLAEDAPEPLGTRRFGPYELIDELGRGGMGVVYRAWEPKLQRAVALKLLLAGPFASDGFITRFLREARLAARLRHPHIVAIYDAGEAEGQPFYTMELVEGRSLASVVQEGLPSAEQAAGWMRTLAQAVESAHREGVLHCDLKSSNILLTDTGEPKIADFGLAKLWRDAPDVTLEGAALGSPSFMAPEQAEGRRGDLGPGTDVYALGAVLYHLLTGRPPHYGGSLQEVLAQVRTASVIAPHLLNPSVPRDLETICLKCLDKDPPRRYASAEDLAEDLGRFLRGEAVRARPITLVGHLWRWARRNRSLAVSLSALTAVSLAGAVAVLWQMRRNQLERERVELEGYATGIKSAALAASEGDFPLARRYLADLSPAESRPDRRGFEWRYLWAATASKAQHEWSRHTEQITGIAFSPSGRHLATSGFDGRLLISEVSPTGELSPSWAVENLGWCWSPYFAADGNLWVARSERNGRAQVVQLPGANTSPVWEQPGSQVALAAHAPRLAIVNRVPFLWEQATGRVEVWDIEPKRRVAAPSDFARAAALSPDGRRLALAGEAGQVRLLAVEGEAQPLDLHADGNQHALAFSTDGRWLASCGRGSAWRWDLAASPPLPVRLEHPWLYVWQVAFSPDSSQLATTCSDRGVRLWDTATGRLRHTLHGHADEVWSAAFHPDGRHLATGSKDGALFWWALPDTEGSSPAAFPHTVWSVPYFSPVDGFLTGCDLSSGSPRAMQESPDGPRPVAPPGWHPCGVGPHGRLLLWGTEEPALRWWDVAAAQFGEVFPHAEPFARSVGFQTGLSDEGSCVFQLQRDGRLLIWDAQSQSVLHDLTLPEAAHSPAGTALHGARHFLLSRTGPRHAWLVDFTTSTIRELSGHTQELKGVALSPDGDLAATASSDGTVRLWETATGAARAVYRTHPESAADVAFSPDGRTLASVGVNQGVTFIHLATGQQMLTVPMADAGSFLAFSPDGRRLVITRETDNPDGSDGVQVLEAP